MCLKSRNSTGFKGSEVRYPPPSANLVTTGEFWKLLINILFQISYFFNILTIQYFKYFNISIFQYIFNIYFILMSYFLISIFLIDILFHQYTISSNLRSYEQFFTQRPKMVPIYGTQLLHWKQNKSIVKSIVKNPWSRSLCDWPLRFFGCNQCLAFGVRYIE